MPERLTNIYFVQPEGGGLIKIGRADDPEKRLKLLQTGSPVRLVLCRYFEATADMETRFHLLFSEYREHGEWFRPCPALANIADAIADETLTDDLMTPNKIGSWDYGWLRLVNAGKYVPPPELSEIEKVERLSWLREPITGIPKKYAA